MFVLIPLVLLAATAPVPLAPISTIPQIKLAAADQAAAFAAAGFARTGKDWRSDCDNSGASYTAGAIESVQDLNGDGLPEALITEGSTYCYGHTGTGYVLVSKQANGTWKRIAGGQGVPTFLATKGVAGWPDMEVGGPGFCFPVERWDGREYVLDRHAYEGKPCRPPR